jgi:hypothetical protein
MPDAVSTNAMLEALAWAAFGWKLMPTIYEEGKPKAGKLPHTAILKHFCGTAGNWGGLRERPAPASEPEIRAWFEFDPECGIGVFIPSEYVFIETSTT